VNLQAKNASAKKRQLPSRGEERSRIVQVLGRGDALDRGRRRGKKRVRVRGSGSEKPHFQGSSENRERITGKGRKGMWGAVGLTKIGTGKKMGWVPVSERWRIMRAGRRKRGKTLGNCAERLPGQRGVLIRPKPTAGKSNFVTTN